ncbi:uncharacterized protein K441DRAFT_615058 [Cenococcum geophilum 1.58]|uniref:uncharacterized protein n=1 Tax=Cenococcum geophilum 1.58 TaxID=794803 RepID=UPI00358F7CE6|nr:hypothetical protein K441DRAFT_615058 [Cenococcum geophilum 1.58]
MVRRVTDDDIGMKVLCEAPAEAAEIVDIVAIHGIGAHPDNAWCKKVDIVESLWWINWLNKKGMLPAIAPNTCIMQYKYKSQWAGKDVIK